MKNEPIKQEVKETIVCEKCNKVLYSCEGNCCIVVSCDFAMKKGVDLSAADFKKAMELIKAENEAIKQKALHPNNENIALQIANIGHELSKLGFDKAKKQINPNEHSGFIQIRFD